MRHMPRGWRAVVRAVYAQEGFRVNHFDLRVIRGFIVSRDLPASVAAQLSLQDRLAYRKLRIALVKITKASAEAGEPFQRTYDGLRKLIFSAFALIDDQATGDGRTRT